MRLCDLHCDTVTLRPDINDNGNQLSLDKGAVFDAWIQCFAAFIDDSDPHPEQTAEFIFDFADSQFKKYGERILPVETAADIDRAISRRKCGVIITVENGAALGGQIGNIQRLYDRGVRLLTLTWNGENALGFGAVTGSGAGLTAFGRDAVRKMERVGIIPDVSHLNTRGFYDVAELTEKPFVATHSNAFGVCNHPRNLTDEQLAELFERGGLVGINLYPLFITGGQSATFDDITRHVEHMLDLGGEHAVALGGDFDGADMDGDVKSLADIPQLYEYLLGKLPESTVNELFFNNAYRFFKENL
ncbi:MAG: dipeptidase [Oscillospiraceae bacterium]|jgi:membrane dipeptidase|nr:dipeptidase [Oscillospiraceae bacterium]